MFARLYVLCVLAADLLSIGLFPGLLIFVRCSLDLLFWWVRFIGRTCRRAIPIGIFCSVVGLSMPVYLCDVVG